MRKALSVFFIITVVFCILVSCATAPKYSSYVAIKGADCPQAQFAADEIAMALADDRIGISDEMPEWTIRFADINPSLGEQAYHIEVLGKIIEITGGDERGLMYGGLEVADTIRLYGIESVRETSGEPYITLRGTKFNIPLDMRTPSYSDCGTSGQENIANMWDMGYWHEYIDELARNRYNVITIWNLNPFPSMVKVPEYPDIALDDVWRVNNYPEKAKGNATDMTKPEFYDNYTVVKKMTIDEKIAFWQEVMQYGADRGIDFYIYTWNVYTFGENGKYGITNDLDNQTTIDYYRCSVREMVKTYPLLKGIGVTAGENMGDNIGADFTEKWLFSTYGLGINDALAETPERDFTLIHRLHYADFNTLLDVWKDFKGQMNFSDKYSIAHMYSDPHPSFASENFKTLPEGRKLYLEIRNDDIYNLKFGDVTYLREYFGGMPSKDKLGGFFMGCDGYVTGRVATNKDKGFQNELFIQKHWINFTMIGRLAYDIELSDKYFADVLGEYYGVDGEMLLSLMETAGKTIPTQNRLVWFDGDSWYPEGNFSDTLTYGYYGISQMVKNKISFPDGNVLSIGDSADARLSGTDTTGYVTAFEIVEELRSYGEKALELLAQVRAKGKAPKNGEEYEIMLDDQEAMATLALYYAEKDYAALMLRMYNQSSDSSYQNSAVESCIKASEYWKRYAGLFSKHYTDELLSRVGWMRISELESLIEKDIDAAKNWKVRKIK
ncbi:MAG: hypothetical protein IKR01_08560 [Spirochaetales bacterium]|nr:hypothetical protein [Spirochaetales bacterium]